MKIKEVKEFLVENYALLQIESVFSWRLRKKWRDFLNALTEELGQLSPEVWQNEEKELGPLSEELFRDLLEWFHQKKN